MLSFNPKTTKVILMGASKFPKDPDGLPEIPAVRENIIDLEKAFTDSRFIGIPRKNIVRILDEEKASDVATRLAAESEKVEDTLIVYYAGHGLLGKSSPDLFLASCHTTSEQAEFNGIPFDRFRAAIRNSIARKKILILDCCLSGRALEAMSSEASLFRAKLDIKGTYALASAPANQAAIAPKGVKYTAFTGELLTVLKEGLTTGKETISLEEIYQHIKRELARKDMPEPQRTNFQDADKIVISRNPRFVSSIEARLSELKEGIVRRLEENEERISQLDSRLKELSQLVKTIPGPHRVKMGLNRLLLHLIVFSLGPPLLLSLLALSEPDTNPFIYFSLTLLLLELAGIIFALAGWKGSSFSKYMLEGWSDPAYLFKHCSLGLVLLILSFFFWWRYFF